MRLPKEVTPDNPKIRIAVLYVSVLGSREIQLVSMCPCGEADCNPAYQAEKFLPSIGVTIVRKESITVAEALTLPEPADEGEEALFRTHLIRGTREFLMANHARELGLMLRAAVHATSDVPAGVPVMPPANA